MYLSMVGGQHSDGSLGQAGRSLLEYLHLETDAMWSLSATPLGVVFPLVNSDGVGLGYLCMVYDGDASRYELLGVAVAASLALINEAESKTIKTPTVPDLTVASSHSNDFLADTRIVAYFQPIVELKTGQVVAIEALARMQTADGVLGPEAFLDSYITGAVDARSVRPHARVGAAVPVGPPPPHARPERGDQPRVRRRARARSAPSWCEPVSTSSGPIPRHSASN